MATEVETLLVTLEAKVNGLEKGMNKARQVTSRAMKDVERSATQSTSRLTSIMTKAGQTASSGFATGLLAFGAAGVVVASVTATVDKIKDAAAELAKIGDVAGRIGITAEALQALQFASEQNAGSAEAVNAGLTKFTANLADASSGSGELKAILDANGVAFTDLNGKLLPTQDMLLRFADLVQNASTPAEQLELAIRAFGKSAGPELVGMLSQGSAGLRGLMQDARDAGGVLDESLIKKAQEIDDKFAAISRMISMNVKGAIVGLFEPLQQFVAYVERGAAVLATIGPNANRIEDAFNVDKLANAGSMAGQADALKASAGDAPLTMRVRPRATVLPKAGGGGGGGSAGSARAIVDGYKEIEQAAQARIQSLRVEQTALGMTGAAAEAYKFEQDLIADALRQDVTLTDAQKNKLHELAETYGTLAAAAEDAKNAQERTAKSMGEFNDLAKDAVGSFVSDLRAGTSAAEALGNMLDRVADKLVSMALESAFSGSGGKGGLLSDLFSGLMGSFGGAKASGGPVQSGKTYLVGENGPEMVRFGRNGTVIPNAAIKTGGGGGGNVQVNIVNNAGVQVTQKESKTAGGTRFDVVLDEMMGQKLTTGGTASNRALRAMGTRQPLTRR